MKYGIKCEIAEQIDDALLQKGFRGLPLPVRWMRQLFGFVFDRHLPMNELNRSETRGLLLGLGLSLPVLAVAFVFALPLEWLRERRARLHNARMATLLGEGTADPAAAAVERIVVNYRIQRGARAVFVGVALILLRAEGHKVDGFTVHRRPPPRDALDGESIRSAHGWQGASPALHHWEWKLRDPYELTERDARPW